MIGRSRLAGVSTATNTCTNFARLGYTLAPLNSGSRPNGDSRSKRDLGMGTSIDETNHTLLERCSFVTTVLNLASLSAFASSPGGVFSRYTAGGSIDWTAE